MTNTGTDTIDNQSTERILHIRYRSGDDDRLIEALDALDQGETPDPVFEVVYHNIEDLHQVTRPTNLELLRTIVRQEPSSIRETARMVDRDVRQVHRNLTELEELGLIDLDKEGRSKRPRTWYDAIEVDLPLGESASTYDSADAWTVVSESPSKFYSLKTEELAEVTGTTSDEIERTASELEITPPTKATVVEPE